MLPDGTPRNDGGLEVPVDDGEALLGLILAECSTLTLVVGAPGIMLGSDRQGEVFELGLGLKVAEI